MSDKTHCEKLERMYLSARVNQQHYPSTTVEIQHGRTVISVDVTSDYHHAANALHGSIYFKLLDDAAYFAANSLVEDVFILTAEFNIKFLRPFTEGRIIARGTFLSEDAGRMTASSSLETVDGRIIATGQGIFARGRTPLSPEIGYH